MRQLAHFAGAQVFQENIEILLAVGLGADIIGTAIGGKGVVVEGRSQWLAGIVAAQQLASAGQRIECHQFAWCPLTHQIWNPAGFGWIVGDIAGQIGFQQQLIIRAETVHHALQIDINRIHHA